MGSGETPGQCSDPQTTQIDADSSVRSVVVRAVGNGGRSIENGPSPSLLPCCICTSRFADKCKLVQHVNTCHSGMPLSPSFMSLHVLVPCPDCSSVFQSKGLQSHL